MRTVQILALLLLVFLIGCGGGGGGGRTTVQNATFQVAWPDRSRDPLTHNLSSAQSALVTIAVASESGTDVQVRINRDAAKPGAYTGTYTVPQTLVKKATTLTATFYSEPAQGGDVVGTATAQVDFASNSLDLGSITISAKVKAVTVVDPGTIYTNSGEQQLMASATDADGAAVAVTPGAISWHLASGTSITLTADGKATPVAAGDSNVTATVDGVASEPRTISVQVPDIQSATFQITWPDRTRALDHGLTSALSAEIKFVHGGVGGADVVMNVNRDATKVAAHTETYTVNQTLSGSANTLAVRFFSDPDVGGPVVGTATATVDPDGTTLNLTNVVVAGTIKSAQVMDPGALNTGDSGVQLFVEALDATNNPIGISAGSINWTLVSGGANLSLTPDGVAGALHAGVATVKATVDGITTADRTIQIMDPGTGGPEMQQVDLSVANLTYNVATNKIWAAVLSDDFVYPNSVVSIDPSNGAVGDRIQIGATPGLIAVSEDGRYAHVTIGRTQVKRLDLLNHTVDATFTVDEGREYYDIQAVPGMPKSFAIAVDPIGGVNLSVWDDGVRRTGTGAVGYRIHFASPTKILGDGHDSLFEDVLTPTQVSWTNQFSLNVHGMALADGKIYARTGAVYDATTRDLLMTLPSTHVLIDKVLAASSSDGRAYFVTWAPNKAKQVLTFNKDTGTELAPFDTGVFFGGANVVEACDNHTVVFLLFGTGVKRTPILVRGLP